MKSTFLLSLVAALVAFVALPADAGEYAPLAPKAPVIVDDSYVFVEPYAAYLFDGPADYAGGVKAGYFFNDLLGVQGNYAFEPDTDMHIATAALAVVLLERPNLELISTLGGGMLSNGSNRAIGVAGLEAVWHTPAGIPGALVLGGSYIYGDDSADQFGLGTVGWRFKF